MFGLMGILSLIAGATAVGMIWTDDVPPEEDLEPPEAEAPVLTALSPDGNLMDGASAPDLLQDAVEAEEQPTDGDLTIGDDPQQDAAPEATEGLKVLAALGETLHGGTGADTFMLDIRETSAPAAVLDFHKEDSLVLVHADDDLPAEVTVSEAKSGLFEIKADENLVATVHAPDGLNAADIDMLSFSKIENLLNTMTG